MERGKVMTTKRQARECKRINKWMRLATFQRLKYPETGNEFMENNPVFGTRETSVKTSTIISRNVSKKKWYDERETRSKFRLIMHVGGSKLSDTRFPSDFYDFFGTPCSSSSFSKYLLAVNNSPPRFLAQEHWIE